MAKRQLTQPWWLEEGTEACSICHHLYIFETEYRCSECDGAVCPSCMEHGGTACSPCSDRGESSVEIEIEV